MKKVLALAVSLMLCLLAVPGLGQSDPEKIDLEIREKMFVTQMTELWINTPDYLGKTIALEGMFSVYTSPTSGKSFYSVYRKSPGCCGNDGVTGLDVVWEDPSVAYPADNEWVRAVGTLEQYEDEGYPYLRLRLRTLDVLAERGLEFVVQ